MNIQNIIRDFTLLVAAVAPFFITSAAADDADACTNEKGDKKIAACTSAINSGRWRGVNLAWAFVGRGRGYSDKNDYDHAIADFTEAIKLDPKHNYAYSNRGLVYAKKGQHDRAIGDYNEAIKLDPGGKTWLRRHRIR